MKRPAVVFFFIGTLLIGGAYTAVRMLTKSNKEKAGPTSPPKEQENTPQVKEQHKEEELEKNRLQLLVYKKLLAETETKLSAAHIHLEDVNDFEFLRTTQEKKDDLKKEYKKINKLEVLRDSAMLKVAEFKVKVAQLEKVEKTKE